MRDPCPMNIAGKSCQCALQLHGGEPGCPYDGASKPELINPGILELNAAPWQPGPTIVTGPTRSGTSMAAQVLIAAGVHMGADLDDGVFEDLAVANLIEQQDTQMLGFLGDTLSYAWGFKLPGLYQSPYWTQAMQNALPGRRYVIMSRDPVAMGMREAMASRGDARSALIEQATSSQRAILFALQQSCPVLLISYEKAIAKPLPFVRALTAFAGIRLSELTLQVLTAYVQPERQRYLDGSVR